MNRGGKGRKDEAGEGRMKEERRRGQGRGIDSIAPL